MTISFPISAPFTPHETDLLEHFGPDLLTCFDSYQQSISEPVVLVCFINRSGSNFLMEILGNDTQFHVGEEIFDSRFTIAACKDLDIQRYDEYLVQLFAHANSAKKTLCAKVSWDQLYLLTKIGFIGKVLTNVKFVLVYRQDVIDQAISYFIAQTTGTWKTSKEVQPSELAFSDNDCENIVKHAQWFLTSKTYFELYFQLFQRQYLELSYEELSSRKPKDVLALVRRDVFGEKKYGGPKDIQISLKIQRNENSRKIREYLDNKHKLMFEYGSFI